MAKHSGSVLDVYGDEKVNGTKIIQFQDSGPDNQRFKLVP
jgi:hypothetical protein